MSFLVQSAHAATEVVEGVMKHGGERELPHASEDMKRQNEGTDYTAVGMPPDVDPDAPATFDPIKANYDVQDRMLERRKAELEAKSPGALAVTDYKTQQQKEAERLRTEQYTADFKASNYQAAGYEPGAFNIDAMQKDGVTFKPGEPLKNTHRAEGKFEIAGFDWGTGGIQRKRVTDKSGHAKKGVEMLRQNGMFIPGHPMSNADVYPLAMIGMAYMEDNKTYEDYKRDTPEEWNEDQKKAGWRAAIGAQNIQNFLTLAANVQPDDKRGLPRFERRIPEQDLVGMESWITAGRVLMDRGFLKDQIPFDAQTTDNPNSSSPTWATKAPEDITAEDVHEYMLRLGSAFETNATQQLVGAYDIATSGDDQLKMALWTALTLYENADLDNIETTARGVGNVVADPLNWIGGWAANAMYKAGTQQVAKQGAKNALVAKLLHTSLGKGAVDIAKVIAATSPEGAGWMALDDVLHQYVAVQAGVRPEINTQQTKEAAVTGAVAAPVLTKAITSIPAVVQGAVDLGTKIRKNLDNVLNTMTFSGTPGAQRGAVDLSIFRDMAAVKEHARDMGWGVDEEWYHGSLSDWNSYDMNKNTDGSYGKHAFYLTNSKRDALVNYADLTESPDRMNTLTRQMEELDNSGVVDDMFKSTTDSDPEFFKDIVDNLRTHDTRTGDLFDASGKAGVKNNIEEFKGVMLSALESITGEKHSDTLDRYMEWESYAPLLDGTDDLTEDKIQDVLRNMVLQDQAAKALGYTGKSRVLTVNTRGKIAALHNGDTSSESHYNMGEFTQEMDEAGKVPKEVQNLLDAMRETEEEFGVDGMTDNVLSGEYLDIYSGDLNLKDLYHYIQKDIDYNHPLDDGNGADVANAVFKRLGYSGVEMDAGERFKALNNPGDRHRIMFDPVDVRSIKDIHDPALEHKSAIKAGAVNYVTDKPELRAIIDEPDEVKRINKMLDWTSTPDAKLSKQDIILKKAMEKELDSKAAELHRFNIGLSKHRVEAPATEPIIQRAMQRIQTEVNDSEGIVAFRAQSSAGGYWNGKALYSEPSFDMEVIYRNGADLSKIKAAAIREAKWANQESVLFSTLVKDGTPGADPGMEVFFKQGLKEAEMKKLTKAIAAITEKTGYTYTAGAATGRGKGKVYHGLRLQYVGDWAGGMQRDVMEMKLREATKMLNDLPEVERYKIQYYLNEVIYSGDYDKHIRKAAEISGVGGGPRLKDGVKPAPAITGSGTWKSDLSR